MTIFKEYFEPVDFADTEYNFMSRTESLFFSIDKNTLKTPIQDIEKYHVAIFGIPEDRNSYNKGSGKAVESIRREFYKLYKPFDNIAVVDLGNLKIGKSVKDTYAAEKDVVYELLKNNVIPLIFGGTQDLSLPVFYAYEKLKRKVNITSIDARFDLGNSEVELNSKTWLSNIVLSKSKYLFNFTNIGFQTYYTAQEEILLMKNLFFDTIRLGVARSIIHENEPYLRESDFVSLDFSSIKQCDAPANSNPSVNGFYAEEVCQLAKYAGLSEKLTSFGLFELNPAFDVHNQTAELAAQIIWHFIQGYYLRQNEKPKHSDTNYKKFIVAQEKSDQKIIFLQSEKTNRWWFEVPYTTKNTEKHYIVSCSHSDYLRACENEIPDKWLKYFQKLN
jgi:arginase family enzyme